MRKYQQHSFPHMNFELLLCPVSVVSELTPTRIDRNFWPSATIGMDCPGVKDDVFRFATFDVDALCHLASRLRDDLPCTCNLDQSPAKGSFNWVIFLAFEDGVEWVLRSPYIDPNIQTLIPEDICAKLLESEVATLKYIGLHTDIPVPTVYSYR